MVYFLTTQISLPITLLIKSPDPPSIRCTQYLDAPCPPPSVGFACTARYHPGLASPPQDSDNPIHPQPEPKRQEGRVRVLQLVLRA